MGSGQGWNSTRTPLELLPLLEKITALQMVVEIYNRCELILGRGKKLEWAGEEEMRIFYH